MNDILFRNIKQIPIPVYSIDVPLSHVKWQLDEWNNDIKDFKIDFNPIYQRDHVWNENQQILYIEHILKHGIGGRDTYWNCPGWNRNWKGTLELVDGKQRITAILRFLTDDLKIYGYYYSQYSDKNALLTNTIKFHINNLVEYNDIIQWYLDLNSGVAHTNDELDRVRKLLK